MTIDIRRRGVRPWGLLAGAAKLALAGYFAYLVLLWPGLPLYAYPVVLLVVAATLRIVTRRRDDLRVSWWYLGGTVLFAHLWFLADEVGTPVRMAYVVDVERWLFLGRIPTVWLQELLYVPGRRGALEWGLIAVYTSYFFVPHLVALLVWRFRPRLFPAYATAYLALLFAALAVFTLLPTAPPWMAAQHGLLPDVARVTLETASGFSPAFTDQSRDTALGNAVAAMPSVHTGATMLVLLAAWASGRLPLRVAGVAYLAAMAFALVYLGEHYVLDVLAGAALASATWYGARAWWGRRHRVTALGDDEAAASPAEERLAA